MQFYSGFESAFLSRIGYLFIRNSIYHFIYNLTKPVKPFNDLTNKEKMVISGFAGGAAAWITTPLTLINIRQILDSQIKP
jgi:solute carrier family 25 oxoglutarate transporter 11